jgi:hypothetical protein
MRFSAAAEHAMQTHTVARQPPRTAETPLSAPSFSDHVSKSTQSIFGLLTASSESQRPRPSALRSAICISNRGAGA